MKIRSFIPTFFTLLVLFLCVGCKKEVEKENPYPTACFNSNKEFAGLGDVINFSNCSENYDRVEWDFGDGGYSTISSTSYRFFTAGRYNVTLRTFKGVNRTETSKIIVAADKLEVNFNSVLSDAVRDPSTEGITVHLYWKRKTETLYKLLADNYSLLGGVPTVNFNVVFNAPDASSLLDYKILAKFHKKSSPSAMLPDVHIGSDSTFIHDINPLNATSSGNIIAKLKFITITYEIKVVLK